MDFVGIYGMYQHILAHKCEVELNRFQHLITSSSGIKNKQEKHFVTGLKGCCHTN